MQAVLLDDKPFDTTTNYTMLGELLDELKDKVPDGRIIHQIFLDDREVLDEKLEALRNHELDSVNTVKLMTSPLSVQIQTNIKDLVSFLKEMRPIQRQAARELRFGQIPEASTKLADCFEGLETLVRSLDQLSSVLPSLGITLSPDELKYFSRKEGAMLGELISEFQEKNWLGVADRLEFQLDPLLGRWENILDRISSAIPEQKESLN